MPFTIVAMLLYRRAFTVNSPWRPLARPSLFLAAASFLFLGVAFRVLSSFGLLERLMLVAQLRDDHGCSAGPNVSRS